MGLALSRGKFEIAVGLLTCRVRMWRCEGYLSLDISHYLTFKDLEPPLVAESASLCMAVCLETCVEPYSKRTY